jgi:hypothetical protein
MPNDESATRAFVEAFLANKDSIRPAHVVVPIGEKVLEVLRFGCEMTCAASAVHHLPPSMPCSAKRWTGERYECSLVAQLKLEDRIAFAEKLLFEWRMAVRSNSTSSRAAAD